MPAESERFKVQRNVCANLVRQRVDLLFIETFFQVQTIFPLGCFQQRKSERSQIQEPPKVESAQKTPQNSNLTQITGSEQNDKQMSSDQAKIGDDSKHGPKSLEKSPDSSDKNKKPSKFQSVAGMTKGVPNKKPPRKTNAVNTSECLSHQSTVCL